MSGISSTLSSLQAYLNDSRNEAASVTGFETSDPKIKANIAYFKKVVPGLTTPDALLKNYRALSVVLDAFGLSSSINSKALLKQLMTQDHTLTTSVASRLGDAKMIRFATAMNQFNPPPFSAASGATSDVIAAVTANVTATITAAATNDYETAQDNLAPGLQAGLYFQRNISNVTTVNSLMSDVSLLKVAVVSSGLDYNSFVNLDFAQQQTALKSAIKFANFKDTKKVSQMVETYLIRQSQGLGAGTSSASMGLSLLNGSADGSNILGAAYGSGITSSNFLSALYPSASSSSSNPLLQLFA